MTRVLLVRLSAMGDVVESLGAVRALAAARPGWELHFVTQRPFVPLLAGQPGIASIVAHERRGGLAAWRATRRALRALRCEVAVDLQGNWKSAACALVSAAPVRLGAGRAARREPASRLLLTRTVRIEGPPHPAAVAWQLVRDLAPDAAPQAPSLPADTAEVAAVAARVAALGLEPGRPFRVVVLTDPVDPRSQRPAALQREIEASSMPVLLLAGPAERAVVAPPGVPCLRQGPGELRELVALGALVAAVGGDVVGPDQGATHVLAAAGARTACLFGPQDPTCTAPVSAAVRQHPAPPACMPCRERRCSHRLGPVCMDFTTAEGVETPRPDWFARGRS